MSDDPSAPTPPAPTPWGFWATIGFGLLATIAMIVVQHVVGFLFVGFTMAYSTGRQAPPDQMIERLMSDPLTLCIGMLASIPVTLGIVWLVVKRRRGWRLTDYLALRGFTLGQLVIWSLVLAGVLWTGVRWLKSVGDDSGDAFIRSLLVGGRSFAPLFFAVAVAAPFIEELLFRGFMFRGLAASRAGLTGAIVLPNILWASFHPQYARPTLILLFAMGLVLGLARHYSRSVTLPLVLHAISNAVSTLSAFWSDGGLN
jgi:membrane protease YdiL (CAAX protease family)